MQQEDLLAMDAEEFKQQKNASKDKKLHKSDVHVNDQEPFLELHKSDVHVNDQEPLLETSELGKDDHTESKSTENAGKNRPIDAEVQGNESLPSAAEMIINGSAAADEKSSEASSSKEEDNGRERLKRHRVEMAGRVSIPEIWGQEDLLKDWIDCTAFDASLMSKKIMSARVALVKEGRRTNSSRLRLENSC